MLGSEKTDRSLHVVQVVGRQIEKRHEIVCERLAALFAQRRFGLQPAPDRIHLLARLRRQPEHASAVYRNAFNSVPRLRQRHIHLCAASVNGDFRVGRTLLHDGRGGHPPHDRPRAYHEHGCDKKIQQHEPPQAPARTPASFAGVQSAVAVARVVHEILQYRTGFERETGDVCVRQFPVASVSPRLAKTVAHYEIAAAGRRGTVDVADQQHSVDAKPLVLRRKAALGLFRARKLEHLAVATREKAHRHADGHGTPSVRAGDDPTHLVHVVRRRQHVETRENAVLFRVVVGTRRERGASARTEQRRGGDACVRPQRITARAAIFQNVETRPQETAVHRLVARAHGLLELRQVRAHRRGVHAAVRVRHHPKLKQLLVKSKFEIRIERLAEAEAGEVSLQPGALHLLGRREKVLHAQTRLAILVIFEHRRDGVGDARAAQRLLVYGRHLGYQGCGGRNVARPCRSAVAPVPHRPQKLRLRIRKYVRRARHVRRKAASRSRRRRPDGRATRPYPLCRQETRRTEFRPNRRRAAALRRTA